MAVLENDLVVGPLVPAAGVKTISLNFDGTGWDRSWLEVYKGSSQTPLVIDVDYTVAGAGTGSAVVTLVVPANGADKYSVYLATPLERSSDMQLRGEFKSEPFNIEMDRLWQRLQYHWTQMGRSLRVGINDPRPIPFTPQANKLLGFDNNLNPAMFSQASVFAATDLPVYATVAGMLAETSALGVGRIILAEGFFFETVASGGDLENEAGNHIDLIPDAENRINFRALGADPSGTADCTALFTKARQLGYGVIIDGDFSMTGSSSSSGLHLIGRGGTITGYDGKGFEVTGGSIILEGDLTITGFGDGTDDQATNYAAAAIRIATGSTIDLIQIGPGVKFRDSRAGIYAGPTTNDTGIDKTIFVSNVLIDGLHSDGVIIPFALRCNFDNIRCHNSTFLNGIGKGKLVCAFAAFIDGMTGSDIDLYADCGNVAFVNNYVENFIQRTTTGGPSDNYETHGIITSCYNIHIFGNRFKNITGAPYDVEAIYVKGSRVVIAFNICENAGAREGAITCKGSDLIDFEASATGGPLAENIQIFSNVILFNRYNYDHTAEHGSGATVALNLTGITVNINTGVSIYDNLVVGANNVCINCYGGSGSREFNLSVCRNKFRDFLGVSAVNLVGGFQFLSVDDNDFYSAQDNPETNVSMVRFETLDIGDGRADISVSRNRFVFYDATFTANLRFINYDATLFACNVFRAEGNIFDYVVGATATVVGFLFFGGDTDTGATLDRLVMKDWIFARKITDPTYFFPIQWSGTTSGKLRNYDIDLKWEAETTDNTTFTVLRSRLDNGNAAVVDLDFMASRTDAVGNVLAEKRRGIYYDNAGTATSLATSTIDTVSGGTVTGVSAVLGVSGVNVVAQINGNASETWRFAIHFKARTLDGGAA
jgi:hypothetical protein